MASDCMTTYESESRVVSWPTGVEVGGKVKKLSSADVVMALIFLDTWTKWNTKV